mmetsp:Transcript_22798/g.60813  ORF Transcript_22798/g.60813 Transcript_22798/m.60813 type:complete len:283 (+) Transcript_22798:495-1343(+)
MVVPGRGMHGGLLAGGAAESCRSGQALLERLLVHSGPGHVAHCAYRLLGVLHWQRCALESDQEPQVRAQLAPLQGLPSAPPDQQPRGRRHAVCDLGLRAAGGHNLHGRHPLPHCSSRRRVHLPGLRRDRRGLRAFAGVQPEHVLRIRIRVHVHHLQPGNAHGVHRVFPRAVDQAAHNPNLFRRVCMHRLLWHAELPDHGLRRARLRRRQEAQDRHGQFRGEQQAVHPDGALGGVLRQGHRRAGGPDAGTHRRGPGGRGRARDAGTPRSAGGARRRGADAPDR